MPRDNEWGKMSGVAVHFWKCRIFQTFFKKLLLLQGVTVLIRSTWPLAIVTGRSGACGISCRTSCRVQRWRVTGPNPGIIPVLTPARARFPGLALALALARSPPGSGVGPCVGPDIGRISSPGSHGRSCMPVRLPLFVKRDVGKCFHGLNPLILNDSLTKNRRVKHMRQATARILYILVLSAGLAACAGRHAAPPGGASYPDGTGGMGGSPQQAGAGPGSAGAPGM